MSRRTRNKRKTTKADGFSVPRSYAGGVVLVAASALVYLWLRTSAQDLGREIRRLEREGTALKDKRLNEEYKWSRLSAPSNVEKTLARYGINMHWPESSQVVWLSDQPETVDEAVAMHSSDETERYVHVTRPRRNE